MAHKKTEDFQKQWAKIIAKAWADPTFKQKLLKNPHQVLKEHGIEFPSNIHLTIEENSDKIVHLILPKKPQGHLSEEDLKKAAGGWPSTPFLSS